jgi:hypothetical protein
MGICKLNPCCGDPAYCTGSDGRSDTTPDLDEQLVASRALIAELRDEIVVLTARAEIAEEDAAEAWATVVDTHRRWALTGEADLDFVDRRHAFLAKEEAARTRRDMNRGE